LKNGNKEFVLDAMAFNLKKTAGMMDKQGKIPPKGARRAHKTPLETKYVSQPEQNKDQSNCNEEGKIRNWRLCKGLIL